MTSLFFHLNWKFSSGPRAPTLVCSNPLKAQLERRGFSYHSSRMNVLIILCGRTVGVITIHSSRAGGKDSGVADWEAGWLNTEDLFTARIEMSCGWTEHFWTFKLAESLLDLDVMPENRAKS